MLRLLIFVMLTVTAGQAAYGQIDNPHADKAGQEAQKALKGYQKKVEEEQNRIARKMGIEKPERQEGQKITGKLGSTERIYIFVSSSMPLKALRRYAADLNRLADPNIVMVMRGFVGGMKHFKPTGDFIESVLKKDEDCEAVTGKCEMYHADIQIDPLLFRRFGITQVPAVVYVPEVQVSKLGSEGIGDEVEGEAFYVVYGDASLGYVMGMIWKERGYDSAD